MANFQKEIEQAVPGFKLYRQCNYSWDADFRRPDKDKRTLPTILYLLLRKVYHSLRTVLYMSSRSYQSGTQSSGFKLDIARARDGSLPTKTEKNAG